MKPRKPNVPAPIKDLTERACRVSYETMGVVETALRWPCVRAEVMAWAEGCRADDMPKALSADLDERLMQLVVLLLAEEDMGTWPPREEECAALRLICETYGVPFGEGGAGGAS